MAAVDDKIKTDGPPPSNEAIQRETKDQLQAIMKLRKLLGCRESDTGRNAPLDSCWARGIWAQRTVKGHGQ